MQVYIFDIASITAILACAKSTSVVSEAVADLRPVLTTTTDDDALAERRSGPAKLDSGEERMHGLPASVVDVIPVPIVNAAFRKIKPVLQRLHTDPLEKQEKTTVTVAPQKAVADSSNNEISKQLAGRGDKDWVDRAANLVQTKGLSAKVDPLFRFMDSEANKISPEQILRDPQLKLDAVKILASYFEHLNHPLRDKRSLLAYHRKARGNEQPDDVMKKLMDEIKALEKKDIEALFQLLQERYGRPELQSFLSKSTFGKQGGKLVEDLLARFWPTDISTIPRPQAMPERERTMLRKEDEDQPVKHPKEIEDGYKRETQSRYKAKSSRKYRA
uniref:RxLR effector candidate protein n=1 Tax=Peronospora matthiolae TaxID=2874970 RepID=A0AAV1TKA9_9STRA